MKPPLLSICIATYNRADYIGETLDSIIPQLSDDVELLIVDGASTDNTRQVVESYCKRSELVRYIKLEAKGGVDQDYDKSVELAKGEWCWLFTDDDLFKPNAVNGVLQAIQQGYDLIVVNAEMRNANLSNIIQKRRMPFFSDRVYAPPELEKMFLDMDDYLTFIGGVVIRRNEWLRRDRSPYFGSEFVHYGVIFQKYFPGSTKLIAEPLVIIRYGNAQWASRHFEIWMFKWPTLVWSFPNISEKAKRKVIHKEPWRKFRMLVYQRSIGYYDLHLYRQYLSHLPSNGLWKLFAIQICFVPKSICVAFCGIYFFFKDLYWQYAKTE